MSKGRKTSAIYIRLTPVDRARIDELSQRTGLSRSEVARRVLHAVWRVNVPDPIVVEDKDGTSEGFGP